MQNEATKLIVQSHFFLAVSLILMSCTAVLYLAAEIVVDLGEVKELQTIASVYFSAHHCHSMKNGDFHCLNLSQQ